MEDLTAKEKETIANVLRYRRNTLSQMVQQDHRIHPDFVDFITTEKSILDKLELKQS